MIMQFQMPAFHAPDFSGPELQNAPCVRFLPAPANGVAPDNYHATSVYPEYLHIEKGNWVLLEKSRMDCAVVLKPGNALTVMELRRLNAGDLGRLRQKRKWPGWHSGSHQCLCFPERNGRKIRIPVPSDPRNLFFH